MLVSSTFIGQNCGLCISSTLFVMGGRGRLNGLPEAFDPDLTNNSKTCGLSMHQELSSERLSVCISDCRLPNLNGDFACKTTQVSVRPVDAESSQSCEE